MSNMSRLNSKIWFCSHSYNNIHTDNPLEKLFDKIVKSLRISPS